MELKGVVSIYDFLEKNNYKEECKKIDNYLMTITGYTNKNTISPNVNQQHNYLIEKIQLIFKKIMELFNYKNEAINMDTIKLKLKVKNF
jgi:hypothetical protein